TARRNADRRSSAHSARSEAPACRYMASNRSATAGTCTLAICSRVNLLMSSPEAAAASCGCAAVSPVCAAAVHTLTASNAPARMVCKYRGLVFIGSTMGECLACGCGNVLDRDPTRKFKIGEAAAQDDGNRDALQRQM